MPKFIGEIENIAWNFCPNMVYFEGYALINGMDISKSNKVKKSIIITNGIKRFFIPLNNTLKTEATIKFGNGKYNYDFAGFEGFIDLEFINDMQPISEGKWFIYLYINANGEEIESEINYKKELNNLSEKILNGSNIELNNVVNLEKGPKDNVILNVKTHYKNNHEIKVNKILKLKAQILKIQRKIGNVIFQNLYKGMRFLKVNNNRVTFLSNSRVDFTGNFEFIYNELQDRGGYDIKYILKPSISSKRTLKDKINLLYYISTSKFILLDDYYPQIYKYKIKENIEVIQLWHAAGAFKTFGFSRLGKRGGPDIRSRNHRNYTKAIVSSDRIKKHYAEAFGISENKVIATGVPRTDIFFDTEYKEKRIQELYCKYSLLKNKKVIMFAPTFRGNGQKDAYYDFDKIDIEKMYNKLSDDYVMIMKLHPFISNILKIDEKYKEFIIDLSFEREINHLLFVSDILITDYSSVCFEYSLLNRPMIFFAYDLEEYIATRDFYYSYESFVPGPIARTTDEIIDIIKNNKYEQEKLDKFRTRFFDDFDGKSTQRVVDMLLKN
ncbi:CDP-glycerol glycerophosphotransferase family protein [Romboutsia sp.]|uniref:CDP-glycerol glycerophosphotransferase family protein n=1 Tax=Romboutsia sp. TaxID=1965302 RepID=UPI003F377A51